MKSDDGLFGLIFSLTFAVGGYLSFNFNSVDAILLIALVMLGVIFAALEQFFPDEVKGKQASHYAL